MPKKQRFVLEKRKKLETKWFGIVFTSTEDISIKNWVSRRPEDVGTVFPKSFKNLEEFAEGHTLECFRCLENEAINYETKALHSSVHMFFERAEVKQKWQGILQDFAFKMGHNKKAPKTATTINNKREVLTTLGDENSALGLLSTLWKLGA